MTIQRNTTLTISLSKFAEDFGFKIDFDEYDDVYHNGYIKSDLKNLNLILPEKYKNLDKILPTIVCQALEDAERMGYTSAMKRASLKALSLTLLKIDLSGGGASYQDQNGNQFDEKASITDIQINTASDEIVISINNPEHLINAIINGVGQFYPDLDPNVEASNPDLIARLHHLKDFFTVYGENMVSIPDRIEPDFSDADFIGALDNALSDVSIEQIVNDIRNSANAGINLTRQELISFVSKITEIDESSIKNSIIELIKDEEDTLKKELELWE
jgi:hypothetical protein